MILFALLLGCNDFEVIAETEYIEPLFDVFEVRPAPPGVDIVMVLDGSGSMENNFPQLYSQTPALAQELSQINSDWRFTAISADPDRLATQGWLDSSNTNIQWETMFQISAVENISGIREEGLAASFEFAGRFPEYFIPENDLYWIFVSDEDDQSSIGTDQWTQLFGNYKTNPNTQVFAGSIIETGTGCGDQVGGRYVEVSDIVIDLCSYDYTGIFDPLLARLNGSQDIFTLTTVPDPGSITVWVNSNEITQWAYDGGQNTITLLQQIPTTSTIVVTYYEVEID